MAATANPTPRFRERVHGEEETALMMRLEMYSAKAQRGEDSRKAMDRKGAKFFRGDMWSDGVLAGRLPITANQAVANFERVAAMVTRAMPTPTITAIREDDEDGARVLEGAAQTNWRRCGMATKLKMAYRLAGFTRAPMIYRYWDHALLGGIGDVDARIVPAYRTMVDDRTHRVAEMEYVGIKERATRAKLIQLFPDKADEIEESMWTSPSAAASDDPLREGIRGSSTATDRLVAQGNNGKTAPFAGKLTVASGDRKRGRQNPASEEVEVEYWWIDDPTPKKERRPMLDADRKPMYDLVRGDDGRVQFDVRGHEVIDTPLGPINRPKVTPKRSQRFQDVIVKKYSHRRHIAWIPSDKVILWDVAWNGPVPLTPLRDTLPLHGYHTPGSALRLTSLGIARNILFSIIFERLKLSLSGTWLAGTRSGLKKNKLTPEDGTVFQVTDISQVKQFPINPLDAAYFNLLDKIEAEMQKLLGLTNVQQGDAAGRADSPATYDKLIEQGGVTVVDRAQLVEEAVQDDTEIVVWFIKGYYTHEHLVEVEGDFGDTAWRAASALATRGEFSVRVETGSMLAYSQSAQMAQAEKASALGFYTLPDLGREGHVSHWKRALARKGKIIAAGPAMAYLLGPGGATPAQSAGVVKAASRRSHHGASGK